MTDQDLRRSSPGRASATFAGRLEEIPRVRAWVDDFGTKHGVVESDVAMIALALDELITNICSYGFDDDREHAIALSLKLKDGVLTASIEDDGRSFNPLKSKAPDPNAPLEQRQPGGLGIFLVRSVVDDVRYRRHRGNNHLTLIKKVAGPGGSDGIAGTDPAP
ncbi:MAG: ATP-binding protein [Geminicoccaceae bacterium]|nr:ATP-binding protein [Geminicoccaceae bacterium]